MLVFIIPLKSAKISRSWSLASRLFERCLRSICQQTSPEFRVVVVCNERPETTFIHPHVHYLEVDYPPPGSEPDGQTTTGYEFGSSQDIARKNADKARRILAGLDFAQQYHPTHTMVVDADDCVSARLAAYAANNSGSDGWYFKKGYMYPEGGRFLYCNVKNFNQICGSSVILADRLRHVLFSRPERDYYGHAFTRPPGGTALTPLPFVGALYSMANGDNIYMSSETKQQIRSTLCKRIFSKQLLSLVRKVLKYRPALLTKAIRVEFGIYDIRRAEAPTARQG